MKNSLLSASLFALMLWGCQSKKKQQVDLDLIPVKSGDYWGYIDHDGKFSINPQYKYAYAFNEGLALVLNSENKYGFVDKSGSFTINPVYQNALGFSEGFALVVKKDSQLEYVDNTGKTVLQLPPEIDKAYDFTEGLAVVGSEGLYGYIDKTGKLIVPFKFIHAFKFSEGLARVALYDSSSKETKFGFVDKKGDVTINYQFDDVSNFSEGLALVRTGSKYGFVNSKGEYVINPQFDHATDFKGGYGMIRQGELWGYIDKKGKIIVNPQFKQTDYFFENDAAAVISTDGKYGFIDKDAKFVINPQFDFVTRFYSDIAIVRMSKKIGLIDKNGKITVNPQFDDCMVNKDNERFINSDFFDLNGTASYILTETNRNTVNGFSKNMNFSAVKSKYPNLNENNYHNFTDFNSQSTNKPVRITGYNFGFSDLIKYTENFSTQQVYDPVAGGYVNQKTSTGYTTTVNEQALLANVVVNFELFQKARDKEEDVIKEVVNRFLALGFKIVSTKEGGKITELNNDLYSVTIDNSNSGRSFFVYVSFIENEVDEDI